MAEVNDATQFPADAHSATSQAASSSGGQSGVRRGPDSVASPTSEGAAGGPRRGLGRFVTVFEGITPYNRGWLPQDVVAGITLAALAIPEVMGYTKIAGTPVITGLYTILLPPLVFAVFGSSRHLVVGGDSATAVIMFAGIAGLGISG